MQCSAIARKEALTGGLRGPVPCAVQAVQINVGRHDRLQAFHAVGYCTTSVIDRWEAITT